MNQLQQGEASLPPNPEQLLHPERVNIATITFYPGWQPNGETEGNIDQLRGDLALETIRVATENGYGVTVIDGGSSEAFHNAATEAGVELIPQTEGGMSGARRQALREISKNPDVDVICMTEPEKVSLVADCLPDLAKPILEDEADIVIPERTQESWDSYPTHQAEQEQLSNRRYNRLMETTGLTTPETDHLDMFMGPRVIRNVPEVIDLFTQKYDFDPGKNKLHAQVKVEGWANTLFFPIMEAMKKGFRVASVPVNYEHPAEQTRSEEGNETFDAKRIMQSHGIITAIVHYLKAERRRPSRLSRSS